MSRGRGLLRAIGQNFMKSLRLAGSKQEGNLIGTDPFGNKFYEVPPDPSHGRRIARRWYVSPETNCDEILGKELYAGFDTNIPAEWEAWLRHRRQVPPTDEQVQSSLALAELKKMNAAKLEEKRVAELKEEARYEGPQVKPQDHEKAFFPSYDEFEISPGQNESQRKDVWADYKNPYTRPELTHTKKRSSPDALPEK